MITIWHNPRCSKSRQALALLQETGADVTICKYLDDAPTRVELLATQKTLGVPAIEMMRPGEKVFKELGLSKSDPDDALLDAMATHPILIERAIVFANGKAVIARPPERVFEII